jgi:hypothetical protein
MPNMDNTLHEWVEQERIEKIGAEKERRAVVAWLRAEAADWEELGADACLHEADNIERGEHLRENEK